MPATPSCRHAELDAAPTTRTAATAVAVGWDGAARGVARGRRHGQADLGRGGRRAARRSGLTPGAAHRRQPRPPPQPVAARGRHRRRRDRRRAARGQGRRRSSDLQAAGQGRGDGRRRGQRRRRARAGRPRPGHGHRHRRRDRGQRPDPGARRPARRRPTRSGCRAARWRTIKGNLFWAFAYNVAAHPAGRRRPAQPDARRRRDGVLVGLRGRPTACGCAASVRR